MSLAGDLEALRPQLAATVQQVLDQWQPDSEGFDELFGYGGACDEVARAMGCVIADAINGIELSDGGFDGDDHAYLVVSRGTQRVTVDIPPGVYEQGSGYNWRKIEGARVEPGDVVIWDVGPEPALL